MQRSILPIITMTTTVMACATISKVAWEPDTLPHINDAAPAIQSRKPQRVATIDSGAGGIGRPDPMMEHATQAPPPPLGGPFDNPQQPIFPNDGHRYMMLQWPLPATGVTSLFGQRPDPLVGHTKFHYGVDMQGHYGQPIEASTDGRVVMARWSKGHGRMVVVQHDGGWRTSYSHLSRVNVSKGQWVRAGQSIGMLGNSGRSTGPHLHFEVTRYGAYHDPLDVLGGPVVID